MRKPRDFVPEATQALKSNFLKYCNALGDDASLFEAPRTCPSPTLRRFKLFDHLEQFASVEQFGRSETLLKLRPGVAQPWQDPEAL